MRMVFWSGKIVPEIRRFFGGTRRGAPFLNGPQFSAGSSCDLERQIATIYHSRDALCSTKGLEP